MGKNDYKAYNAYLSVSKSNPSEHYEEYYKEFMKANFHDSTSIKAIKHNSNEEYIDARVVSVYTKEAPARRMDSFKKIIFDGLDYDINIGDMFEFDDRNWLCTDVKSDVVNKSCSVLRCNNYIKVFVNDEIHQIPVVIEDQVRFYDLRSQDTNHISIPDSKIIMLVSANDITRGNIGRSDVYKISDSEDNYTIIDRNSVIIPGIIVFKLEFTSTEQILPEDIEGEEPEGEEPENEDVQYQIVGSSEIKVFQSEAYEVQKLVYDSESEEYEVADIIDKQFDFEIIPGDTPGTAYQLDDISDIKCEIECKESVYNIILKAVYENEENGIELEKEIQLMNLF